jgi:hypothetical protein
MHTRLVSPLEERFADGEVDPTCWPRAWQPRRDPSRRRDWARTGRRARKASSPPFAPPTISTGWRRSPRSPRAVPAPWRPPPTWLATCATTIRGDPEDPDEGGLGEEDGPDDFFLSDDDDEFDDLTMEGLFLPVPSLSQVLGAIDEDERLTALGWWGLPEAMLQV